MIAYNRRLRWYTAISKADNNSDMTSSQFLLDFQMRTVTADRMTAHGAEADLDRQQQFWQTRWLWESSFTSESTFHYTVYTARSRYDPKKSFTLFPSLHAENSLHSSASILYSTALRKKPRILSHPSPCPHWGNWFLVCRKPFWQTPCSHAVTTLLLLRNNQLINMI